MRGQKIKGVMRGQKLKGQHFLTHSYHTLVPSFHQGKFHTLVLFPLPLAHYLDVHWPLSADQASCELPVPLLQLYCAVLQLDWYQTLLYRHHHCFALSWAQAQGPCCVLWSSPQHLRLLIPVYNRIR